MKKIEILKRMIREEVRKTKLSEVTKYVVTWSDRDYKPHKKVFIDDPQGPAENGLLKAKKFMQSLEKKDAQSPYGLYRNIDLEWLSENRLKETSFNDEVDDLATNLVDYLGTELPTTGWNRNPRIVNWFRENGIQPTTPMAQDIYRRALELNQDNKPSSRKYLDN